MTGKEEDIIMLLGGEFFEWAFGTETGKTLIVYGFGRDRESAHY
jgi:hypothetical protein